MFTSDLKKKQDNQSPAIYESREVGPPRFQPAPPCPRRKRSLGCRASSLTSSLYEWAVARHRATSLAGQARSLSQPFLDPEKEAQEEQEKPAPSFAGCRDSIAIIFPPKLNKH